MYGEKHAHSLVQKVVGFFRSFTIEPVGFMCTVAGFLVFGAAVNTNLLLWKVCKVEMGIDEAICDDLTAEENEDIQTEVQKRVNDILLVTQWIASAPAIFYSLFIGSLSDDVGRKPLITFPLFGQVLTSIALIINYAFIETLPTEFYYVTDIWSWYFGGTSVYYLGYYGYGTSITTPKERATRLARFDGMEQLGQVVGTILSPLIFNALGYYGIYVGRLILMVASLVYMIWAVREPIEDRVMKSVTGGVRADSLKDVLSWWRVPVNFTKTYIIIPFRQMLVTVIKRRPRNLRMLLLLQLVIYGAYLFVHEERGLFYLYLNKVFEGFEGTQNAIMTVYTRCLAIFALFVITPFLSLKLKIHEGLILTLINVTLCLGTLIDAFAVKMWQVGVGEFFKIMWYVEFSVARSLITKCIEADEVGKLYSAIAVLVALLPALGSPVFRGIYNKTIDTFPSAYMLLAAAIVLVLAVASFFLYLQRGNMLVDRKGRRINVEEERKNESTKF